MMLSKPGESIRWGNENYAVGEQAYATNTSEYHGLIGTITEIQNGDDKEMKNYLPDIFCFQEPIMSCDRENLEKRFSDEIALDMVIMGHDMLVPMKVLDYIQENPQ